MFCVLRILQNIILQLLEALIQTVEKNTTVEVSKMGVRGLRNDCS